QTFSRSAGGSGSYTRTDSGAGATLSSGSGTYGYRLLESGSWHAGAADVPGERATAGLDGGQHVQRHGGDGARPVGHTNERDDRLGRRHHGEHGDDRGGERGGLPGVGQPRLRGGAGHAL